MNKRFSVIIIISMISISVNAFCEKTRTLTEKNDFGGATVETIYVKGDKLFHELGLMSALTFYDTENKIKQVEYNYNEDKNDRRNFNKKIEYYDADQHIEKGEYFFTDNYAEQKGYNRAIDSYDLKGKPLQSEYFYTDKFSHKEGYNRAIFVYADGFIKQKEYYYINDFAGKIGYFKRIDYFVYDAYANEKLTEKAYFDKNDKEIKREKE